MKHIYKLFILALIMTSCSGDKKNSTENVIESGNIETIRKKRGELVIEQQAVYPTSVFAHRAFTHPEIALHPVDALAAALE